MPSSSVNFNRAPSLVILSFRKLCLLRSLPGQAWTITFDRTSGDVGGLVAAPKLPGSAANVSRPCFRDVASKTLSWRKASALRNVVRPVPSGSRSDVRSGSERTPRDLMCPPAGELGRLRDALRGCIAPIGWPDASWIGHLDHAGDAWSVVHSMMVLAKHRASSAGKPPLLRDKLKVKLMA
jgi:hypothetical protein